MASPHPDWDDTDDGYRRDDVGIFVEPAVVDSGPGTSFTRSGGISPNDANAYAVEIRTGMETAGHTWDVVANFSEARAAWEFANILTHYFEARVDELSAKSNLLTDDPDYPGDSMELPTVVEDYNAEQAFLAMLHPGAVPEPMRDLFDDEHKF